MSANGEDIMDQRKRTQCGVLRLGEVGAQAQKFQDLLDRTEK